MFLELFEKVCKEVVFLILIIILYVLGDFCKFKNLNYYLSIVKCFFLKVDLVISGVYLYDFEIFL